MATVSHLHVWFLLWLPRQRSLRGSFHNSFNYLFLILFGFYSFRGSRIVVIDNVDHFCLFAEIIQHNYLLIMVH